MSANTWSNGFRGGATFDSLQHVHFISKHFTDSIFFTQGLDVSVFRGYKTRDLLEIFVQKNWNVFCL